MKTESTTTHDGASDAPWKSPTLPANSAWADIRPTPAAKTNALTLQLKATTAFKESLNSDDDSGDDSDEEDVDYWPDPGAERFQLFRRIFVEDGELRRYFEENYKGGEFFCFVCGGIGKKSSGRSFKSCQGLLQHVAAMSKVERSQSHRAFGLVVCKVLGWDFDQIPSVVVKGVPLGRTLGANACAEKREAIAIGDVKDNVEVPSDNQAGLVGNESSSGKGDSVGDVTFSMKVVCNANTFEKKVFESNDKGRVGSKGGLNNDNKKGLVVIGTSEAGGNENKSTTQLCSEGKAGSVNQSNEEKASEDSDNEEEDASEDGNEVEEEEDPSEEEEEENPSENGNGDEEEDPDEDEEEDPNEVEEEDPNEYEEEDPTEEGSEEEEEDKDPSKDENGDGNDCKDKNKSGATNERKRSTVPKSCSLDQPMSQLGITQGCNQPLGSSSGWPCGEAVLKNPLANMGWPVLTPKSAISLSPEEQVMLASDKLQHKAVKLYKDFLRTRSSLGSRDNHNEEEKEQEEDPSEDSESENEDEDVSGNSKEYNFFSKLFSEDVNLRDFYANDCGSQDFRCLVCGGVGKEDWKRFTSVTLVQHSTAILKTRKKLAHMAYGEVVCEVLGWHKNRLPSIVMRSELHGQDQPWMKLNAVHSVEGTI